jgi:single-strand DNA-binding protein
MNKVELIGRLTKDPEERYTQTTNTMVANFTLAVNRRYKKDGEPDADFINCVAWKKTAEFIIKHFKKGNQIGVAGRIQTRNYDDQNGNKRFITEIIAEEIYFADGKKNEEPEEPTDITNEIVDQSDDTATALWGTADDLPF